MCHAALLRRGSGGGIGGVTYRVLHMTCPVLTERCARRTVRGCCLSVSAVRSSDLCMTHAASEPTVYGALWVAHSRSTRTRHCECVGGALLVLQPAPRRLQLRLDDIRLLGGSVSFTPARFNTEKGGTEHTIATSTGPYVVTWNFRRVKQGRLQDYQVCHVPGLT